MAGKVHVKKGDLVKVLTGKDRGKRGKVLSVEPDKGRVLVDGVNILKRHTKPTQKAPQGGIVERPGPLAASNVMLVCPNCDEATRIGRERDAAGNVRRICKSCGRPID
ncbi:MAG TPA: 50S ribosomal protein L24 [Firmicutes bacterium]|nr:50S ribosomal protein L24 [Bacillota bacterium]